MLHAFLFRNFKINAFNLPKKNQLEFFLFLLENRIIIHSFGHWHFRTSNIVLNIFACTLLGEFDYIE